MFKILKNLTKKESVMAIIVVCLICVQIWLDLTLPDFMSEITMLVQTEGSRMSEIIIAGGKMVGCALGSLLTAVFVSILASRIASNCSYILRGKVFNKVMSFSMKDINGFSTASLITRTTNDITQVQMLIVMGLQMLVKAPLTAIWAIWKIAGKNSSWTIATGVAVLVLFIIVGICLSIAVPRFKKIQGLTDEINDKAKENLNGLNVIRAYNAEEYQKKKFEKVNDKITTVHLYISRAMSFLMPSIQTISNVLILSIYLIGAVLINEAIGMEKMFLFSDMVVFSAYAMQVIISFMMLVIVFMILPRAQVSARRISEVLNTKNEIIPGNIKTGKIDKIGEVEFKNVSFKYPDGDGYILKNINFTAKKGEVVALIGSTGCGKSTIINLVPRFYDATEGTILVNGIDVKEYDKEALNNIIGYVSQKATLFSGTIKSNIAYGENGKKVDEKAMIKTAVETAKAKEFVENLEDKYDSHVAQGGTNLSGGQKQRISIARSIFRNPEIFIFDDSFSALDYKTDRELRQALNEECRGTTRLIVGQRIGTIRDADKIIVIEDGEIVGIGKHEELLEKCEEYKQIALSQLSKEELA